MLSRTFNFSLFSSYFAVVTPLFHSLFKIGLFNIRLGLRSHTLEFYTFTLFYCALSYALNISLSCVLVFCGKLELGSADSFDPTVYGRTLFAFTEDGSTG